MIVLGVLLFLILVALVFGGPAVLWLVGIVVVGWLGVGLAKWVVEELIDTIRDPWPQHKAPKNELDNLGFLDLDWVKNRKDD